MPDGQISLDDPRADDVRQLLARHLAFAHGASPPEDAHALDVEGLVHPTITFYSFRRDGRLLGVGALKELGDSHGELKSMHTAEDARRQGVARALLEHLVAEARRRGYRRISLETGSMAAFAPARALYRSAGFTPCQPFADYRPSPNSAFMSLQLGPPGRHA